MQYFGFDRPSFGIKTFGFGANFDPMTLFAGGKQGVWFDPSDKSTLFQDVAGTVPVTKDGDPVALMKDKSGNNNHATQSVSASRPVYKTDGVLHWLEFDGTDDSMITGSTFIPKSVALGYELLGDGAYAVISNNNKDAYAYFAGGGSSVQFYILPATSVTASWVINREAVPYKKVTAVGGYMGTLNPVFINGKQLPPRVAAGTTEGFIGIGARGLAVTPSWYGNIKLYSVLIMDSDFTPSHLELVSNHSNLKSGIVT